MKKRILLLFALLMIALPVLRAAKYEELSVRSAGRVLSVRLKDGFHFFIFLRPMPIDSWMCREYLSGKDVELYPEKLELMPFFDQNDDFAIEILTSWYILHSESPEYGRYQAFAKLVNLPGVFRSRHFVETVRLQEKEIAELKKSYSQTNFQTRHDYFNSKGKFAPGTCCPSNGLLYDEAMATKDGDAQKQIAISTTIDLINDGEVFREIDAVFQTRNYFLAIAFLDYYRKCVNRWLSLNSNQAAHDFAEIRQKFDSIEKNLVANYRREREMYSACEDGFSRACPKLRGLWKQSVPVSFGELVRRNTAAFLSWQQSRELAPDCDFPEWGNHMLDLLSMMPGIDDNAPVILQFKDALKKYQDAFANEVN